jgi:hypothetical protein
MGKDLYLILASISFCLAGTAEAVMDVLQFKFEQSSFSKLNPNFWNPKISWQNKWKKIGPSGITNEERFFLSSTVLVFLTDGWHLMKWVRNRFLEFSIFFFLLYSVPLEYSLIITIFTSVLSKALFELLFNSFS